VNQLREDEGGNSITSGDSREVTSSEGPRRRPSSRVIGLDAARVLATLGIVWVHTAEIQGQDARLNTLGRFGTSFYILAAVFLAARSHLHRPETRSWDVALRRARRLLIPYVLWCLIYAIFYFSTMYPQGHPADVITRYWGILFGTAPHLWFLPFAFVAGVLASLSVPKLLLFSRRSLVLVGGLVTIGLYVFVYGWAYGALNKQWITSVGLHRLARWVEEAPLVVGAIFGVAIYGKSLREISRWGASRRRRVVYLGAIGFLLTQAAYGYFLEDLGSLFWNRVRFFANVAGAFWMVTFLAAWQGPWTRRLAPLGSATYFAYLSHQMILDSVKGKLQEVPGYGSLGFACASTLGIFALAVALGLLVSRVRFLRWLSP